MNTSVIRYLLGYILKLEGFLLLLPCIVAGIYCEKSGIYFLIVALISIAIGFIFSARKPKDFTFYLKEGCATTALGWIIMSIFGCLPFMLTGEIPSPVNPPSGCKFHTRCSKCMEICKTETPVFKEYAPGHRVACHLYEQK